MSEIVNRGLNVGLEHASTRVQQPEHENWERVQRAVQQLNSTGHSAFQQGNKDGANNYFKFAYDAVSRRPVVTIVDQNTQEVLMQIPTKEVLRLAAEARRKAQPAEDAASKSSDEGILA